MLARQALFRRAADVLAAELAAVPEVRAITLFGSVARPLEREVPRFRPYRYYRIEILHECRDIDLAVWIDRFDNLAALNRARGQAVASLFRGTGIGVAHHQVEIFLFGHGWHDYRGRLCTYGQCPKGKVDCLTPGCGRELFPSSMKASCSRRTPFSAAYPCTNVTVGTTDSKSMRYGPSN